MAVDPIFLTRSAEGLDRRGFSLADIEKMIAAGVFASDERFELFGGEVVPCAPQTQQHALAKGRLANALVALCRNGVDVAAGSIVLDDHSFFEADIVVFRAEGTQRYIGPPDVLLAVEIADSSRSRDLFTKAPRYGAAGVPELWVVELNEQQTYVFREPGAAAWSEPARVPFDEPLTPLFLPKAEIRLGELL